MSFRTLTAELLRFSNFSLKTAAASAVSGQPCAITSLAFTSKRALFDRSKMPMTLHDVSITLSW